MQLFKKPKWLKPEVNELKYWIHLLIIVFIVLFILQRLYGGDMLNVKNIIISALLFGFADIIAHTILGLD